MPPRARVLLLTPLPPPVGGISTWTLGVLASPLAERFELEVLNVAPELDALPLRDALRAGQVVGTLLARGVARLELDRIGADAPVGERAAHARDDVRVRASQRPKANMPFSSCRKSTPRSS